MEKNYCVLINSRNGAQGYTHANNYSLSGTGFILHEAFGVWGVTSQELSN